jgi:hypothetical protein
MILGDRRPDRQSGDRASAARFAVRAAPGWSSCLAPLARSALSAREWRTGSAAAIAAGAIVIAPAAAAAVGQAGRRVAG